MIETLKKQLPYTNQIWCPFHKDQLSQSICLDNNCNEKILCYLCEIYSTDHKILPLSQFYNSLNTYQKMNIYEQKQFSNEIQKAVEGKDIEKKLQYYTKQANTCKEEYQTYHIQSIEKQINGLIEALNSMVQRLKSNIVELYKKMT